MIRRRTTREGSRGRKGRKWRSSRKRAKKSAARRMREREGNIGLRT